MKERMLKGSKKKNPLSAALASVILPGAGQAYNREIMRAIILILLSLVIIGWGIFLQYSYEKNLERALQLDLAEDIARMYAEAQGTSRYIPLVLYVALVVFSAYDAYAFAAYIARNLAVEVEKEEFNLPPRAVGNPPSNAPPEGDLTEGDSDDAVKMDEE